MAVSRCKYVAGAQSPDAAPSVRDATCRWAAGMPLSLLEWFRPKDCAAIGGMAAAKLSWHLPQYQRGINLRKLAAITPSPGRP